MVRLAAVALCGLMLGSSVPCAAQGLAGPDSALAGARAAADAWLALIDGTQYEASWDSASALFRGAIARTAWQTAVLMRGRRSARSVSGPCSALPIAPSFRVYRRGIRRDAVWAEVSGDRKVVETVTPMKEHDGRWRVSGYYIRPR